MDEDLMRTFRAIYTAVQQGDADALAESLAHDVEWVFPEDLPWGGVHHGHLGVVSFAETFLEHVDGPWADVDEFMDADDRVVALGRISGRVRETGAEFEASFAHVWTLTDGVPSRLRGYYDTAPITAALRA
jgi:uncharacterized protein